MFACLSIGFRSGAGEPNALFFHECHHVSSTSTNIDAYSTAEDEEEAKIMES